MKGIRCAALLALLLAALVPAAGATSQEGVVQIMGQQPAMEAPPATALPDGMDMDYSGLLDPQGGNAPFDPTQSAPMETQSDSNLVPLSDTCFYDKAARRYVIFFQNSLDAYYFSSVPEGMTSNQMVSLEVPPTMSWILYRDGDQMTVTALDSLSQVGTYVLEVTSASGLENSTFSFEITSGPTNHFPIYKAPTGFTISSVTVDGKPSGVNLGTKVDLTTDGVYLFDIFCSAAGLGYQVRIESDRTPPTLLLDGVVDGEASHAVSLADAEAGATLSVKLDGAPYNSDFSRELTQVGRYEVRVTDKAANYSDYSFHIKLYLTLSSTTAILLLVAAVAAVFAYSRYVRKHARVR